MIHKRLKLLRNKMIDMNIDYYVVPSADAHRNEYVPDCWQRRAWISGFTGSAGEAVIGRTHAYLWTDGRYFLQAEQQLDPSAFQLMKQLPGAPSIAEWLETQGKNLRIGVDPKLITVQQYKDWQKKLSTQNSLLIAIENNWVDELWEQQPESPTTPIFLLSTDYSGLDTSQKLKQLRAQLTADCIVVTRLDAIAWLFNVRGHDIAYNPLVISYAIITQTTATLFIDLNRINDTAYFNDHHITLKPYEMFNEALNTLTGTVLIDPNSTSWWTLNQLQKAKLVLKPSPITLMKAIKNPTERYGMREAHRIDAIAMIQFLHWIETHWQEGITEISAADQLEQFRRADSRCKDLSFSTISGFGSNGAIIHYSPTPKTNKKIDGSSLYLIDSGGQYLEGTTDVTRTIHLGQPTAQQKQHYTLVLKGHLALRHAIFKPGTYGEDIDHYARNPLRQSGYDYAHGTGHGVGCYLCVHEGPHAISPRKSGVGLQPGMMVSNEPGLYLAGEYGIRIENICEILVHDQNHYSLGDLTLVPYAQNLIDINLITDEELDWINYYHHYIYTKIALDLPTATKTWLKKATNPINRQ